MRRCCISLFRALPSRGFTLVEGLLTAAIFAILMFAVGAAIVQTLHVEAMNAGRSSINRTAAELALRLAQEARSSTAVFVPSQDVFGNSNAGESVHEVDFFRKLSAGGDAFVAYTFDSGSGAVTRYEYTPNGTDRNIVHADLVASNVAGLNAVRVPVSTMSVVGAQAAPQVQIKYGYPEVVGGNDVIVVKFTAVSAGGAPGRSFEVHLSPPIAPTNLSILVSSDAPSPAPTGLRMTILHSQPGPHNPGSHHGGIVNPCDPGNPNGPTDDQGSNCGNTVPTGSPGGDSGSSTSATVPGVIGFDHAFDGDWNNFAAQHPTVQDGTYSYRDDAQENILITFACDGGCPPFVPIPVDATSSLGTVVFQAAP